VLAGDIDIRTAPALRERLGELVGAGQVVVVDLSAVEFLDSSGLGAFVGAANALRAAGGSLRLACPRPHVQKIFRISRLAEVIPIHEDVASAAAS
jgi:anti-sigma B factor antagonist